MGDLVVVHYGGGQSTDKPKHYFGLSRFAPFNVPWAVAEIVCMFEGRDGKILIEIRWYYRQEEIRGGPSKLDNSKKATAEEKCFKLIETDHIDVVPANSILAPATLQESLDDTRWDRRHGMPILNFASFQFWSIKRNREMSAGLLEGRIGRGQLYSAYPALFSLTNTTTGEVPESGKPPTWEGSVDKVIENLSLGRTYEEACVKGGCLVGREEERGFILGFLRSAIKGSAANAADAGKSANVSTDNADEESAEESHGHPSSIIIGGPPGTG